MNGHISYTDNLCCYGTTVMKDGLTTIGNTVTFPMLRLDEKKKLLLEFEPTAVCNDDICINTRMKLDEDDNDIPDR